MCACVCLWSQCALCTNSFSRFLFFLMVLNFGAPFNNRLRGNTESSLVDTGVSLSTHTSTPPPSPQSTALLWGSSFPAGPGNGRKGRAVGDHVMMSQQEIKTGIVVGETSERRMSKREELNV